MDQLWLSASGVTRGDGLRTGKRSFPVVIAGFLNACFTADILDGTSGFDGLENGNDLMFSESGFTHGDLLRGHNQYVGRSLKVNGAVKRDTYTRKVVVICGSSGAMGAVVAQAMARESAHVYLDAHN
jgi:hypothetical protein